MDAPALWQCGLTHSLECRSLQSLRISYLFYEFLLYISYQFKARTHTNTHAVILTYLIHELYNGTCNYTRRTYSVQFIEAALTESSISFWILEMEIDAKILMHLPNANRTVSLKMDFIANAELSWLY